MENLLGKFYVLTKCCICKRSVCAASGLNTALHTEPVYSCVGYSSLHCIELWPLSCHGWSADFLIWCSQHLTALGTQLCSIATKTSFQKYLQETLSIFCSAVLLLTFAFMVYCIKTAILKSITGAFKGNVYENEFNVFFSKLVHVQVFGSPNLPHCSEQGLYGNGWPSPLFSNRTFTRGNKNAEMFNDKIANNTAVSENILGEAFIFVSEPCRAWPAYPIGCLYDLMALVITNLVWFLPQCQILKRVMPHAEKMTTARIMSKCFLLDCTCWMVGFWSS